MDKITDILLYIITIIAFIMMFYASIIYPYTILDKITCCFFVIFGAGILCCTAGAVEYIFETIHSSFRGDK